MKKRWTFCADGIAALGGIVVASALPASAATIMYADSVTKLKYQSATSRDVRADAAEFIVAKRLVDNPTETLEEIVRLVLLVSSKAPPASVRETEIEDIAEGFADAVYSAMECTTDGLN